MRIPTDLFLVGLLMTGCTSAPTDPPVQIHKTPVQQEKPRWEIVPRSRAILDCEDGSRLAGVIMDITCHNASGALVLSPDTVMASGIVSGAPTRSPLLATLFVSGEGITGGEKGRIGRGKLTLSLPSWDGEDGEVKELVNQLNLWRLSFDHGTVDVMMLSSPRESEHGEVSTEFQVNGTLRICMFFSLEPSSLESVHIEEETIAVRIK